MWTNMTNFIFRPHLSHIYLISNLFFHPVLVFICTTASFIAQISSSENVSKQDAILAPVAKQWIAEDIPSYGSQSKRVKIAIQWVGKY